MKIRKDHILHYFVCYFLTTGLLIIAQWWIPFAIVAFLIVFFIGVGKEIHDIKTTGFDWTDILADLAGIGTAMVLFGIMMIRI